MYSLGTYTFLLFFVAARCSQLQFPPHFRFGAATASYQIEGAWNVSDKGESIWDRLSHRTPSLIADGSTGDVACDSYHLWETDIAMAKDLGLDFYRFSLSWPRIMPKGFSNVVSEDGVRYYNQLIDALLAAGIQPMVTVYHWDLPQRLQDLGGWTNPLIADWFTDYARVVFSLYGDRVQYWLTINEPAVVCDVAYNSAFAPGIIDHEATYICTKNVLLAHAKAWRVYDQEFKPKYHGKVAIANHFFWYEPLKPEYEDLTNLVLEYGLGRYLDPIYSPEGGWPTAVEAFMEEKSKAEGYPRSKLPKLTKEEIKLIKGTYDFFSFNHYTSRLIAPSNNTGHYPFFGVVELGAGYFTKPEWEPTFSFWYIYNPMSMRHLLRWLRQQYGDHEFVITENGMSTGPGLDDHARVKFYQEQLTQVLLSIKEDGINVTAYTAWTLMDNFEWTSGYSAKFGLYEVDFEDPKRKRTPRQSAHFYKDVIKNRALSQLYKPKYEL